MNTDKKIKMMNMHNGIELNLKDKESFSNDNKENENKERNWTKSKTISMIFLFMIIIGLSALFILPPLEPIGDEYWEDVHFQNPNVRLAKPYAENNSMVYFQDYIHVDSNQNQSAWDIAQWNVPDYDILYPEDFINETQINENYSDPLLGTPTIVAQKVNTSVKFFLPNIKQENYNEESEYNNTSEYNETEEYNVYSSNVNDNTTYPITNPIIELHSAGGILTPGGGKNLFISNEMKKPIQMQRTMYFSLQYRLTELKVNGTAPENMAQVFMGFVLHREAPLSDTGIQTIFLQIWIANTNGETHYAGASNGMKALIYGETLPEGLQYPIRTDPALTIGNIDDEFSLLRVDLTLSLQHALNTKYHWLDLNDENNENDDVSYIIPKQERDYNDWQITVCYIGLETQGGGSATIQLTYPSLEMTESSLYTNLVWYIWVAMTGLIGLLVQQFIRIRRKDTDDLKVKILR